MQKSTFYGNCPESKMSRIFDVQEVLGFFFLLFFPQIYSLYSQDIYLKSFSVANSSKHVCIEYKLLQPEFDALQEYCIRVSFTIFYSVELKKPTTKYEQFTKCKVATKFPKGQIVNVRISPKDQRHRVPSLVIEYMHYIQYIMT